MLGTDVVQTRSEFSGNADDSLEHWFTRMMPQVQVHGLAS